MVLGYFTPVRHDPDKGRLLRRSQLSFWRDEGDVLGGRGCRPVLWRGRQAGEDGGTGGRGGAEGGLRPDHAASHCCALSTLEQILTLIGFGAD